MVCVDTFSSVHMALFALAGGRAELPPPTHHPTVKHTQICSDGSERSGLSDDCEVLAKGRSGAPTCTEIDFYLELKTTPGLVSLLFPLGLSKVFEKKERLPFVCVSRCTALWRPNFT